MLAKDKIDLNMVKLSHVLILNCMLACSSMWVSKIYKYSYAAYNYKVNIAYCYINLLMYLWRHVYIIATVTIVTNSTVTMQNNHMYEKCQIYK